MRPAGLNKPFLLQATRNRGIQHNPSVLDAEAEGLPQIPGHSGLHSKKLPKTNKQTKGCVVEPLLGVHAAVSCNPRTWETEIGKSEVQSYPPLHRSQTGI